MRNISLLLLTSCLLCACGQTGALYLPDSNSEEVGTPAAAAPPAASPDTTAATSADATAPAATTAEERERANAARSNRGN